MQTINNYLREKYLEYVNDYLTVDKFAEDNRITPTDARRIISMGKVHHEDYVFMVKCKEAEKFFYEYAGWGYHPDKETPEEGRQKGAVILATAEMDATDFTFKWSIDPDIDSTEFTDNEPWELWQCVMFNEYGDALGSLHGIDFGPDGEPDGQPYKRVVEAELAQDYFNVDGE